MTQLTAPRSDELEISVFGPGYGESLLIHTGSGRWIAIDSCIDAVSRKPKALEYLDRIAVDPRTAIRLLVASHWHDDHVRGIFDLFRAAESATFVCSKALTKKEFIALADLFAKEEIVRSPRGPHEFHRCLGEVERRLNGGYAALKFAAPDRTLWAPSDAQHIPTRLISLSPSDEMDRRCVAFMATTFAFVKRGVREDCLLEALPNDVAVALRLDVAGRSVLLGSDLEEEGDPLVGWSAVLNCELARELKSATYKVAHHGSKSGHHDAVWTDMLVERPLSLITPFRHGKHRIPTKTDRTRILSLTDRVYISADPARVERPKSHVRPKTGDLIDRTARNRRRAVGPVGHIRWRVPIFDLSSDGKVDLYEGAMKLADVA